MSINRRQFNRITLLSSASLATTSAGIFFPKPAEAYSAEFPLQRLSSDLVFNGFQRFSAAKVRPGTLSSILAGSSNTGIPPTVASAIRSSDSTIARRNFAHNRTELAETITLLWGRQRQDPLGTNVGFGFVQKYQDGTSSSIIWGPTMTGIHLAQPWLADQRLTPNEIAGSLLPVRSTFDDLSEWSGSGASFTSYRTVLGEVTSRYDRIAQDRGRVQILVESETMPRRNIVVDIKFNTSK